MLNELGGEKRVLMKRLAKSLVYSIIFISVHWFLVV